MYELQKLYISYLCHALHNLQNRQTATCIRNHNTIKPVLSSCIQDVSHKKLTANTETRILEPEPFPAMSGQVTNILRIVSLRTCSPLPCSGQNCQ